MGVVFVICIMGAVVGVVLKSKRDSDRDDENFPDSMMFM